MNKQSDLLVSVDLGTTYTGVAWMTPRTPIQVVNDWPGSGDRGERKVPTKLVYNDDGTLSSWGFICEDDDDGPGSGKIRREFFKIFIDQDTLEAARQQGLSSAPQDTAEARKYLTDYLRQIYAHVEETVETQLGRRHTGGWTDMAVTFLFSVPTTWTNIAMVNTFKGVVRDTGFGTGGPSHVALVDLTEAEAASVATLKTSAVSFQKGHVFLTVDAGGGTTDLALMRITSTDAVSPQMAQVSGHKFGEKVYMQQIFKIPMEGVAFDFNHPGLRVERGRMLFTKCVTQYPITTESLLTSNREEIQALFDVQIEGVMSRIKEQLEWMREKGMKDQVEYMVLAGGLGSSAYVRDAIQQQLVGYPHPNARHVIVVPCQEPQLCVVRGLLLDQQQRFQTGSLPVLATRVARSSYGMVVMEPYDPAVHFDEDVKTDKYDPKIKWARSQIEWLIRKGDVIDPNSSLIKSFKIKLDPGSTTRSWDAIIVISNNEPHLLPRSMKHAGAKKLCVVKSNLTGVQQDQMVLNKNRRSWYRKGVPFYHLQFDVHVIVAPADLRFELWFNGYRFSGNHEPITVTWD
ncbi:uncharacterized protein NECHADRAFT_63182 [Fusarium vanettenii 77-13-4]|uniref:Hsp70 family chaperone n=1 Tax=Fusarium vanettenii (strain ATCC MYA-4622 / CBS 123669 / FGSC 9596 / NRRL 45880 / 77-13-4) TaxID=660122 RepID=C7Z006_FUSV7|nr:uncharacterized protein NECHADRAFT_63182 [Fusarium vanettenii 77-13-4]EEU42885.1 hypothetical protein NECHADRAFT_63182 [Fusarium vanettenii 77-13-4]